MNDIVVEVRGGLVVEIYSNHPGVRFVLVDWDKINDGTDSFCWGEPASLSLMPEDTCARYHNAVLREDTEQAAPGSPSASV
jgi:hypothetical protein